MVRGFRALMGPIMPGAMRDGLAASEDADLLIISGSSFYIGVSIAEKLELPYVQAYVQPVHPTTEFPSALFPTPFKGGSMFNYLTHVVGGQSMWQMLRPIVNDARREVLSLDPYPLMGPWLEMIRQQLPIVYGYSGHVLPKPHDWPDCMHVTGYWFLREQGWTPPQQLLDFLADGPSPVYIGFGSMVDRDPERMTEIALDALRYSGQRAIFLRGWGGLQQTDLPSSVFMIDQAPHEWLFPRMAAIVHHGGAGTTAASIRAGVPSIIVPFFGDQPFWADRVSALGVGIAPLARKTLNGAQLAGAIDRALRNVELRTKATALGERVRAEDGVTHAVGLIEAYAQARGIARDETVYA
jgi:UDP:flavonoid glycosyltransferase YjiC (YdhE family)